MNALSQVSSLILLLHSTLLVNTPINLPTAVEQEKILCITCIRIVMFKAAFIPVIWVKNNHPDTTPVLPPF